MSLPVSFNAFVVSLVTTAAVHFGDLPDPESGKKPEPNLEAAGHAIEMLAMLAEKTKGNLTEDEARFITQALYELRARYVGAKKGETP